MIGRRRPRSGTVTCVVVVGVARRKNVPLETMPFRMATYVLPGVVQTRWSRKRSSQKFDSVVADVYIGFVTWFFSLKV